MSYNENLISDQIDGGLKSSVEYFEKISDYKGCNEVIRKNILYNLDRLLDQRTKVSLIETFTDDSFANKKQMIEYINNKIIEILKL